jgi:hypothetical protein
MSDEIFLYDLKDYNQDINPIEHYVRQATLYLHKTKNISLDRAESIIRESMKNKTGPFSNITDRVIKYAAKNDKGDREIVSGSLIEYINNINKSDVIVAPTLTTYIPHEKKEALSVKFVEKNKKERSKDKELKLKYKLANDEVKAIYYDIQQSYKKIINNSFSGAFSSPYTILYFKTGHNTLTTATRLTTSNSNSLNEKLLTGNRHYYSVDIIINNIIFIISKIDKNRVYDIINKYNLYIPSVDDCLNVVSRSADLYCLLHYKEKVYNVLSSLDDAERSWFVYCNDFYHLCIFNKEFISTFFDRVTQLVKDDNEYQESQVFDYPEEYRMCASQICYRYVKGFGKNYTKMKDNGILKIYIPTIKNCYDTVQEYGDFFSLFFKNQVVPHSVAQFPHSLRRCILTSDTDSTIPTYQEIIFWYLGKEEYSDKGRALQGFLILLSTYLTSNVLMNMSAQFNPNKNRLKDIYMKNEYTFDSYATTQMAKHYYATISVQEGNAFANPEREYKGVHLISSNLPLAIRSKAKDMMNDIMDKTMSNKELSLVEYMSYVRDIEQDIINSVNKGEISYFKVYKIKDSNSYKSDMFNPYCYAELWNSAFGPRSAAIESYPYQAIKVSTILTSKVKLTDWLNTLDPILKGKVEAWIKANNKKDLPMIMLPVDVIKTHSIPAEISRIIDYHHMVKEICTIFYTILSTIGFYIKEDFIISDYFKKPDMNNCLNIV